MLNVTKELTALARKLGYTGNAPDTVAKAINAITASVGEGGGGGDGGTGVTVVNDTNGTLDKTFKEIADAFVSGGAVIKTSDYFYGAILYVDTISYSLIAMSGGGVLSVYGTSDEDSYPVLEDND